MNIQTPFTFASVFSLGVWRCAGLCLWAAVAALGKLLVFWASSPYCTLASSSGFGSARLLRSLSFSGVGSNPALNPTRLRRSA